MSLYVYQPRGGHTLEVKEKYQVDEIIKKLGDFYGESEDNLYLCVDVKISPNQFDIIGFKSNSIFFIEAKNWSGEVLEGNVNGSWRVDGKEIKVEKNPYEQTQEARRKLRYDVNEKLPFDYTRDDDKYLHISSVLYFPKKLYTNKIGEDVKEVPWLKFANEKNILNTVKRSLNTDQFRLSDEDIKEYIEGNFGLVLWDDKTRLYDHKKMVDIGFGIIVDNPETARNLFSDVIEKYEGEWLSVYHRAKHGLALLDGDYEKMKTMALTSDDSDYEDWEELVIDLFTYETPEETKYSGAKLSVTRITGQLDELEEKMVEQYQNRRKYCEEVLEMLIRDEKTEVIKKVVHSKNPMSASFQEGEDYLLDKLPKTVETIFKYGQNTYGNRVALEALKVADENGIYDFIFYHNSCSSWFDYHRQENFSEIEAVCEDKKKKYPELVPEINYILATVVFPLQHAIEEGFLKEYDENLDWYIEDFFKLDISNSSLNELIKIIEESGEEPSAYIDDTGIAEAKVLIEEIKGILQNYGLLEYYQGFEDRIREELFQELEGESELKSKRISAIIEDELKDYIRISKIDKMSKYYEKAMNEFEDFIKETNKDSKRKTIYDEILERLYLLYKPTYMEYLFRCEVEYEVEYRLGGSKSSKNLFDTHKEKIAYLNNKTLSHVMKMFEQGIFLDTAIIFYIKKDEMTKEGIDRDDLRNPWTGDEPDEYISVLRGINEKKIEKLSEMKNMHPNSLYLRKYISDIYLFRDEMRDEFKEEIKKDLIYIIENSKDVRLIPTSMTKLSILYITEGDVEKAYRIMSQIKDPDVCDGIFIFNKDIQNELRCLDEETMEPYIAGAFFHYGKKLYDKYKNMVDDNKHVYSLIIDFMPKKEEVRYDSADPILHDDALKGIEYIIHKQKTTSENYSVLFHGPPGCGKTTAVYMMARELDYELKKITPSMIRSKWVGESEKNIEKIFEESRKNGKAIIFIDEIDAFGLSRDYYNDIHEYSQISQLMTEIESTIKEKNNVLVIGATNKFEKLDKAFKRPERFNKKQKIPLPDAKAREKIFRTKVESIYGCDDRYEVAPDIDYAELARLTEGKSGAEIEQIVKYVDELIFYNKLDSIITQELLERSIEHFSDDDNETRNDGLDYHR